MKRRYTIPTLAILLISGACGLKPIVSPEPAKRPGDELFSQAESLYNSRSYEDALEMFEDYLTRYPKRPSAPDALMRIGAIQMLKGRTVEARAGYERLIRDYPGSPLVPDARIAILDTHYEEGNHGEVIRKATGLLKRLRATRHRYMLYSLLGDAYGSALLPAAALEAYGQAYTHSEPDQREGVAGKMSDVVQRLASADIISLLGRIEDGVVGGFLSYQLGQNYLAEDKVGKAVKQLSAFVEEFPDHAMMPTAEELLSQLAREFEYQRHTIGCLLPLTGRFKKFGVRALKGIELALARLGMEDADSPMTILIKDTESSPDTAAKAVSELVEARVTAIIGPLIAAEGAIQKAQEERIPIITLNQKEGITDIGDYVFRNFITPRMQAEAIVSHAVEKLGLKRFAILYPDETYGETFMGLLWEEVDRHGAVIVGLESYEPSLMDFADPIRKLIGLYYPIPEDLQENDHRFIRIDRSIVPFDPVFSETLKAFLKEGGEVREDARDPVIVFGDLEEDDGAELVPLVDFDAIIIPDAPKKAGLIIPQLVFFDIENVFLFGTNLWHSPDLIDMARDNVQGAILTDGFFPESRSRHVSEFVRFFNEVYGQTPAFIEAVAYDTARLLFGIAGNPAVQFRQTFRDEIAGTRDYDAVTGLSSVSPTGDIQKQLHLLRIKGDGFVETAP